MWLHPVFFSMGRRHCGQSFVLASTVGALRLGAVLGLPLAHRPARHRQVRLLRAQDAEAVAALAHHVQLLAQALPAGYSTARPHRAGHHLMLLLSSTYDRAQNPAYRCLSSSSATSSTRSRITAAEQDGSGHRSDRHRAPSSTAARTYPRQHTRQ
ncbi:hypothetical protein ZWY2020_054860 [Hordeum vulgare]|nr:hypothetical protein ZWY2020_054860 [Hordeum vulgare]